MMDGGTMCVWWRVARPMAAALAIVVAVAACEQSGEEAVSSSPGTLEMGTQDADDGMPEDDDVYTSVCAVGERVGDAAEDDLSPVVPREPPRWDPHFRVPVEPPDMEPGWQKGPRPTEPKGPVAEHVLAALAEYKDRARTLSPEEAAELKSKLLGER
jgi:hypothetical protein